MQAYITKIDGTEDSYRKVADEVLAEPLPGLILHAAGHGDDGGRWIVEVWESVEAEERFARERLFPALERLGVTDAPTLRRSITVDNVAGALAASSAA